MGGGCCEDKECGAVALKERQGRVLKAVLSINAGMFVIEASAGLLIGSTSLLADSLDMLGDALVYAFSLYVLSRGARWQAASALIKGLIMAASGLFVLGEAVYRLIHPAYPSATAIGAVGALALLANSLCLFLLWRHRGDDINMHSVWLCSRNDIIANAGVLVAALGVWASSSVWPDLAIGLLIAAVFLRSAAFVTARAVRALALRP